MQFKDTSLPGVVLIAPTVHRDDRGYFFEGYRAKDFATALKKNLDFVQGNVSCSKPWTVRGLHYQLNQPQGKLVRCLRGSVYDVAVDLRKKSATFGKFFGVWLDDKNHEALWVPPEFAHGFLSGPEGATVSYECTTLYAREWDRAVRWNDPTINVTWPLTPQAFSNPLEPNLSEKDRSAPFFADLKPTDLF